MFQIINSTELALLQDGVGIEGSIGVIYQLRATGEYYVWNPQTRTMDGFTAAERQSVKSFFSESGNLSALTAPGLLSSVTYDASNRATVWTIDGVTYTANYSSGAITVAGSDGTVTNIGVDPAQRITSVATA